MKTKPCIKCHKRKNSNQFPKRKSSKDGRDSWCKECINKNYKKYRKNNKVIIAKKAKTYYQNNKERIDEYNKIYRRKYYSKNKNKFSKINKISYSKRYKNKKWILHYYSARRRCNNPKVSNYEYYGGCGIKCLMTKEDFKFLWFRDNAYLMKQPSIDRKNNDKNYTLENCRFIELIENIKNKNK